MSHFCNMQIYNHRKIQPTVKKKIVIGNIESALTTLNVLKNLFEI